MTSIGPASSLPRGIFRGLHNRYCLQQNPAKKYTATEYIATVEYFFAVPSPRHQLSLNATGASLVDTARTASACSIWLAVVQQSGRIATRYCWAALEIAVWVTQGIAMSTPTVAGAQAANKVARRLVVPPHRQGGQAQFVEQPMPATASGSRLAGLIDHLRANLHRQHSLDSLAAEALLSRRSLTRAFRQHTGTTVGDWLLRERLAYAQRLLECSDQPVERIAELAGFGTSASLRQLFGRAFGLSPRAWRLAFRG